MKAPTYAINIAAAILVSAGVSHTAMAQDYSPEIDTYAAKTAACNTALGNDTTGDATLAVCTSAYEETAIKLRSAGLNNTEKNILIVLQFMNSNSMANAVIQRAQGFHQSACEYASETARLLQLHETGVVPDLDQYMQNTSFMEKLIARCESAGE